MRSDGTLACWGLNDSGQASPPSGTFTRIIAGYWHTCGVRSDGTLACWGLNDYGQTTPPAGAFTQLGAGFGHTCGRRDDGTLVGWGDNTWGQSNSPAGAFTQVGVGGWHTCGIRSDGTGACWGANDYGQLGPTLTVAKAGTGVGAVGSNSAGIACGATCRVTYPPLADTAVTLTASPAAGSVFAGWSGACTGTPALRRRHDRRPQRHRHLQPRQLRPRGRQDRRRWRHGDQQPGRDRAAPTAANPPLRHHRPLAASPAAGSVFAGWSGACTGTGTCTVAMTAARSVTAAFQPRGSGLYSDLDGDGKADLAGLTGTGQIFYSTDRATWTNIPGQFAQLVVGDVNGDGRADLAGRTGAGQIFYSTNLSSWTNIPGALAQLVAGDFNGDGKADLAGLTAWAAFTTPPTAPPGPTSPAR